MLSTLNFDRSSFVIDIIQMPIYVIGVAFLRFALIKVKEVIIL